MEIKKIKIYQLKPAKYNPRKELRESDIEYQKIENSIKDFGLVEPLVINKDMTVISGHQRLKILTNLGYTEIDCVMLDVDKTKEKALNLALNKISGVWERKKLKDILMELEVMESSILSGFDIDEIENIIGKPKDVIKSEEPEVEFSEDLMLEHNYIILYFDNPLDWQAAVEKFNLKEVKSNHPLEKCRKIGIGRVVKGKDYL